MFNQDNSVSHLAPGRRAGHRQGQRLDSPSCRAAGTRPGRRRRAHCRGPEDCSRGDARM